MPGLGRIYRRDDRDRAFMMHEVIDRVPITKTYRYYRAGPVLDQGETPQCVGYSLRNWLSASLMMEYGGPNAPTIYTLAQLRDKMTLPHDGSTVRAGIQVLAVLGYVQTYVWAYRAATVRDWLLADKGSVILGTNWLAGMMNPDGVANISAIGAVVGGHAYLCDGFSTIRNSFRIFNSWGISWGNRGHAWLSFDDLDQLLQDDGECCTAVEQRVA